MLFSTPRTLLHRNNLANCPLTTLLGLATKLYSQLHIPRYVTVLFIHQSPMPFFQTQKSCPRPHTPKQKRERPRAFQDTFANLLQQVSSKHQLLATMCHVLYQIYACDHARPICITACPPAISASTSDPFVDSQFPPPYPTSGPLGRSISASSRPLSIALSQLTIDLSNPSNPGNLGPNLTNATTNPASHLKAPHPYTQLPSYDPAIVYCPMFRPTRAAPTSRYPCLKCFIKPAYREFYDRWVNDYRVTHPLTDPKRAEELSGVLNIASRVGVQCETAEKMEAVQDERAKNVREGVQRIGFERVSLMPEGFERWSVDAKKKFLAAVPEIRVMRWEEVRDLE